MANLTMWERGGQKTAGGGVQVKAGDMRAWALIHPGEEFWAARTHAPERTARQQVGQVTQPSKLKKQGPRDRVRGVGRQKAKIGVGWGLPDPVRRLLCRGKMRQSHCRGFGAEPVPPNYQLLRGPQAPGGLRWEQGRLGGAPAVSRCEDDDSSGSHPRLPPVPG